MCTYETNIVPVFGSAKGQNGWFSATQASVYFDHPVRHPSTHALLIDVMNTADGPSSRVALELDPQSARALAETILATLDHVPDNVLVG